MSAPPSTLDSFSGLQAFTFQSDLVWILFTLRSLKLGKNICRLFAVLCWVCGRTCDSVRKHSGSFWSIQEFSNTPLPCMAPVLFLGSWISLVVFFRETEGLFFHLKSHFFSFHTSRNLLRRPVILIGVVRKKRDVVKIPNGYSHIFCTWITFMDLYNVADIFFKSNCMPIFQYISFWVLASVLLFQLSYNVAFNHLEFLCRVEKLLLSPKTMINTFF